MHLVWGFLQTVAINVFWKIWVVLKMFNSSGTEKDQLETWQVFYCCCCLASAD